MSESAPRRFTLHVDFLATDEHGALNQAEAYVEALNLLRLEIDGYTARVSRDGGWSASKPVYCGAPGPDPTDVCTARAMHPPPHSGPGVTGKWSDDEVPRVPDTIETMTCRYKPVKTYRDNADPNPDDKHNGTARRATDGEADDREQPDGRYPDTGPDDDGTDRTRPV